MKRFDQKLIISAKKKSDRIFSHQIGCHDCQEGNPLNVKKKEKKIEKLQNTQRLCFKQTHGEKTSIYMQKFYNSQETGPSFQTCCIILVKQNEN